MWAGTDDDVEINILGDKGETNFQQLELYLSDIGIVTGVILRKSHMLKSDKWQVDNASYSKKNCQNLGVRNWAFPAAPRVKLAFRCTCERCFNAFFLK